MRLVAAFGQQLRRFAHEVWQSNGYYKRVMQSYLAWRKTMFDILESTDASADDRERARFALSLLTEAVAPTNTLLGNPGAAQRIAHRRHQRIR